MAFHSNEDFAFPIVLFFPSFSFSFGSGLDFAAGFFGSGLDFAATSCLVLEKLKKLDMYPNMIFQLMN